MKTKLTTLLIIVSAITFAQKPDYEKIKSLKVAHITEQLQLSEEEAQQFWPIYNKYDAQKHELRKNGAGKYKTWKNKDISESEAKKLVSEMLAAEEKRHLLFSNMVNDLSKVIPYKKIITLLQSERSFNRRVLERFKERHKRKNKTH